jgi:excisionase family DNA binding protein
VAVRSRSNSFSPSERRGGGLGGTRAVRVPPINEIADSGTSLLLRPVDVATALGISRSKVFELLATQELPSVHIGRSTRIPRAQLEAWIQAQVCWQPQAPAGLLGRLRSASARA